MKEPTPKQLFEVLEATWPAASTQFVSGWRLRTGLGGGQRVSAATWEGGDFSGDLRDLEIGRQDAGHAPLVMVRSGEGALDEALAAAGYAQRDETAVLLARAEDVAQTISDVAAYPAWPPLAAQNELWTAEGIGASRLAIMERVATQKTALLGRRKDTPVATLFAAVSSNVAMVHALVVAKSARRMGAGTDMMRSACDWALRNGAEWLSVLVVRDNAPALSLYHQLGLREVANYHYRTKERRGG